MVSQPPTNWLLTKMRLFWVPDGMDCLVKAGEILGDLDSWFC